jgi:hypothetical protein
LKLDLTWRSPRLPVLDDMSPPNSPCEAAEAADPPVVGEVEDEAGLLRAQLGAIQEETAQSE